MGWKKVLGFRHGWNETVIRQFYATLEVQAHQERLMWMTGPRRFEATFRDLAAAVRLDYCRMQRGKLVSSLPMLLVGELPELFYQEASAFSPKGGMRMIPKVLFEILRHTIVPSAAVEGGAIGWPSLEVIYAVLSGEELNLLDLLANQMLECKRNEHAPLALQPYIMALVLHTVKGFYGARKVRHQAFLPYRHDEVLLERPPSP